MPFYKSYKVIQNNKHYNQGYINPSECFETIYEISEVRIGYQQKVEYQPTDDYPPKALWKFFHNGNILEMATMSTGGKELVSKKSEMGMYGRTLSLPDKSEKRKTKNAKQKDKGRR